MAATVITFSQLSTYARIHGMLRAVTDNLNALKQGVARAVNLRRNMPHSCGLTLCSLLFVLVALIIYGDAALNNHVVHLRSSAETRTIYTTVMQSVPALNNHRRQKHVAGRHWSRHALHHRRSLRSQSQPTPEHDIDRHSQWHNYAQIPMRRGHLALHRKGRSGGHQTQGCTGARQRIAQSPQPQALGNRGIRWIQSGGNDGKINAVPARRARNPAA
eukprot:2935676-Pleurochrysis_carterae.AAC.2